MTISKFRRAPRRGHLNKMKRIYGYLCKVWHYKLRFRVDEPDYSNVQTIQDHDRKRTFYGKHQEDIYISVHHQHYKIGSFSRTTLMQVSCMTYYLGKLWLVYVPSLTRPISTGIACINLHPKRPRMLQHLIWMKNMWGHYWPQIVYLRLEKANTQWEYDQ